MNYFNNEVQASYNGPWSAAFKGRVDKVRSATGLTLQKVGDAVGFSGPFVHNLLNGGNMGSQHGDRVLKGLEALEHQLGIKSLTSAKGSQGVGPTAPSTAQIKFHIGEVERLTGCKVSLSAS